MPFLLFPPAQEIHYVADTVVAARFNYSTASYSWQKKDTQKVAKREMYVDGEFMSRSLVRVFVLNIFAFSRHDVIFAPINSHFCRLHDMSGRCLSSLLVCEIHQLLWYRTPLRHVIRNRTWFMCMLYNCLEWYKWVLTNLYHDRQLYNTLIPPSHESPAAGLRISRLSGSMELTLRYTTPDIHCRHR